MMITAPAVALVIFKQIEDQSQRLPAFVEPGRQIAWAAIIALGLLFLFLFRYSRGKRP